MAEAVDVPGLEGRCYTKARRYPSVVGRWPGGGRIPGGPYALQQLVVATVVFGALFATRSLWGVFGLGNYALLLAAPLLAAFAARRLHIDGRSPLAVAGSAVGMAVRPRGGRQGGRGVRAGRKRLLDGRCSLAAQQYVDAARAVPGAVASSRPTKEVPAASPEEPRRESVRSGAAALLARAGEGSES